MTSVVPGPKGFDPLPCPSIWYCRCHPINLVPLVVTKSSHGYMQYTKTVENLGLQSITECHTC